MKVVLNGKWSDGTDLKEVEMEDGSVIDGSGNPGTRFRRVLLHRFRKVYRVYGLS